MKSADGLLVLEGTHGRRLDHDRVPAQDRHGRVVLHGQLAGALAHQGRLARWQGWMALWMALWGV